MDTWKIKSKKQRTERAAGIKTRVGERYLDI
jgi:hypothetical protein